MNVGQTVEIEINGQRAIGTVRTAPTLTASGSVVSVELLPDFAHLLPTGWTDANIDDLTAVKVCACATLGYRPDHGDRAGELFTTGCDFGRTPKGRFLPGHDAKAKGFLIRASQATASMTNGLSALENAREFGDKIALHVAKGMDTARRESHKRATSRRWRQQVERDDRPARREDQMDEVDRLQRELGVTDSMLTALARGSVDSLNGYKGKASAKVGTEVALLKRGLTVVGGYMTDLGYKVVRQPTLTETDPDAVICRDDNGGYNGHHLKRVDAGHRECSRCGAVANDN